MKLKILFLLTAVLNLTSLSRATVITNEFWIHPYSTGAQNGTLQDPFNGSTKALFDAKMAQLTTNRGCIIHLLQGTYDTAGAAAWKLSTNQVLAGSGIDITTLRLTTWNTQCGVIESVTNSANVVVQDLTVNCNYSSAGGGAYTVHGITLYGDQSSVRRIKCIDAASAALGSVSALIIYVVGSNPTIEECEVSSYNPTNQVVGPFGIYVTGTTNTAFVRNNRVVLPSNSGTCYMVQNAKNTLIEGNYADGGLYGIFGQAGAITNLTVVNNYCRNSQEAIEINSPVFADNILISNNKLDLPSNATRTIGITLWSGNSSFGSVVAKDNAIRRTDGLTSGANTAFGFYINRVPNAVLIDNLIDTAFTNNFDLNGQITAKGNLDFAGIPLTNFNQVGASFSLRRKLVTTTTATISPADRYIGVRASSSTFPVLTLPDVRTISREGKELLIIDEQGTAATTNIVVNPVSPQLINGASSSTINANFGTLKLITDGTNWIKL